jgi:hypothetical protein
MKIFTIATLALVGLSNVANAQVCFSPKTDYTTGNEPYAVISADFNKDGKLDLAVDNKGNSSNVSVFLGDGLGGFGTATNFALQSGAGAISLISDDFNKDGNADLAVAELNLSKIGILLGNGAGSFSAAVTFTASYPSSIISADFNGDGNADLSVTNFLSKTVSLLMGTGTGSFGVATSFPASIYPTAVISADFNADGKADLAVANGSANNVFVLLSTGTGSFAPADSFMVGSGPRGIITADFNADGKADLATSNGGSGVSILIGNGAGSFATVTTFPAGTTPQSLYSADFDGDGKTDIVAANSDGNNVSVLLGNGIGGFGTATNFAVGLKPEFVISADFNSDGKADLAVANRDTDNASVLLNCSVASGINQQTTNKEQVNIYPNPSTGIFNLTLDKTIQKGTLIITNILGEQVYNESFYAADKTTVNLSHLSNGIYLLQISDGKLLQTQKLIIQK